MMNIRILGAAAALALCCTSLSARSKIVNGDSQLLKNKDVICTLKFDFSNTSIENVPYVDYMASKDEQFCNEWTNEVIPYGLAGFVKSWNKENKRGLKLSEQEQTEYVMVLAPTYLNLGNAAMSTFIGFGAGGDRYDGSILIYKGDELLLTIKVERQTGKSNSRARYRFMSLMSELASDTLDDVMDR